jgi:dihydroorotate dehydrogenase electron transfer subunit
MEGAFELVVEQGDLAAATAPGQFFQIAVGAPRTLLRRPYSAAWTDTRSGQLGFIFNAVGAGSRWLSQRQSGDWLDLLGPLGHGFDLSSDRDAICVAGGLGMAVFPGVVRALLEQKRRVRVLLGARTSSALMPAERFGGAEVRMATDDGSAGFHGSAVELLEPDRNVELFACGPTPMLQALVHRAQQFGMPLSSMQIALETPMGCGIGTCLGCVVPSRSGGYLLTCQEGPCVPADRLDWSRIEDAFHG